ncbi:MULTISPECIES: LysR family transcriptional regulator [unclassified Rhodococcus (in: high G+C Gram-positive bacteria)]|uniref:LysR family transcriptional regulator n=1 Tax=unclassified Rhodococcus (in: high G+C Gram-positive bacteria) TaxID=192944 RepID=UPI00146F1D7A|nr:MULTISPECIES: LysR family transcriptional regulator [unclassified Rhodococcus (in: high G+C Gram-positive bacteria)]MCK0091648.1 LysR family transcriptional regulator [Rhodococcus sp. F64268]NLU63970.1 LysR family transcriptional regulator [Rhodococcus sp. HNM0563]HET8994640.1 LysR family transcriptional regulator [Rhodococcus sp. (in: high G+C Gram-positive bacteria)]
MEFRQIEYFLAVVENDGINGAAAALGVAQPTVSQALRSLERELSVQLFHRIGRGMVLTAAGHSLIGPSRQILRDVAGVEELLTSSSAEVTGRLDLMVFPALATGPIIDLVAQFRRAHPKATVRFGDLRTEGDSASLIRDGHCEFVVAHLPLEGRLGLDVIELGEQEYWMVYPPGTELPPGPVTLSAMPPIPMVFVPRGGGTLSDEFDHEMRQGGHRPRIAALANHREARLPMVLAGVGGSLVERSLAESVRDIAVVRPCEPTFTRTFGLVFDPAALSKAGRAFVDLAKTATNRT